MLRRLQTRRLSMYSFKPHSQARLADGQRDQERREAVAKLELLVRTAHAHGHQRYQVLGQLLAAALEVAPQAADRDRENRVIDCRARFAARRLPAV